MLSGFFLRIVLMLVYRAHKMKNEIKAEAGRKGGLARVAKGFAVNVAARAKAIRASARTRKAQAAKRRRLAGLLIVNKCIAKG